MSDKTTTTAQTQQPPPKPPPSGPAQPAAVPQYPKDAPKYLIERGWRPEGDPYHPHTLWMDPTKPSETREERVKIGTRKLPNNRVEDVYQVHVTPAAFGVRQAEAVAEQMRRERQAAEKKG